MNMLAESFPTPTPLALLDTSFTLRAGSDRVMIAPHVRFHADGTIGGFDHPALSHWSIGDRCLLLLGKNFMPNCRFDLAADGTIPSVLLGRPAAQATGIPLWLESERYLDLTELANRYGTDKGTTTGDKHGYTEIYASMFESFRTEAFTLLEVGLLICDRDSELNPNLRAPDIMPSMDMWLSYFPNARCYGFDLSDFTAAARRRDRFTFLRGNLSVDADLQRLAEAVPSPRIIIDDASHAAFHQQRTFAKLFPILEPGGFYVIEDLHYSPPFETALPPYKRMWHVLRTLLDEKRLELDCCDAETNEALRAQFEHVFVHCSARGPGAWGPKVVVIQKKRG